MTQIWGRYCIALSGLFGTAAAIGAEVTSNKTMSIRYESTVGDHVAFPGGCDALYKDIVDFMEFFESSLVEVVLEKGANAKGVSDLFAVSEMRVAMKDNFPNLSEESPLDRLILTQLCQFEKIRLGLRQKAGNLRPEPLTSGDTQLHDHLLKVAPKLYRDARALLVTALAEQARLRERGKVLAFKRAELRRAREQGRERVDDLFTSGGGQKRLK